MKSSRPPIDFSDSEREESEYETDGEEDDRAPQHRRVEELEEEDEYEDDDHDEDAVANEASEEEPEVCRSFLEHFVPTADRLRLYMAAGSCSIFFHHNRSLRYSLSSFINSSNLTTAHTQKKKKKL